MDRPGIDNQGRVIGVAPAESAPIVAPGGARPDLRAWHESSWSRPLAVFLLTFGFWLSVLGAGLWTPQVLVRAAMVVPLTLATAQLFTLAHDAGHGSFSTSRVVNAVVGRLALVPSMHVFSLWRIHHDVHHRFTNLRGRDHVWTPLTVAEFRALPRWRRRLHRICRHRSGLGLGVHYMVEIWVPRMLWPRHLGDHPRRGRLIADSLLLYGLLAGLVLATWRFASWVAPERAADPGYWASVAPLLVVPLVGAHWLIGFVIYLNHTHPDVVWYDDPAEWSTHQVQLEGSVGLRVARLQALLVPRRIMSHTAHHVDPGVPLWRLGSAQRYLLDQFGDRIVSDDWSPRRFAEILSHCKLYDYETKRWLTYVAADHGP